jgi:GNAT superfamily N-acetyltransferase
MVMTRREESLEAAKRVTIRHAEPDDALTIYRMLRESAAAQGGEEELCVDPDSLREDGFVLTPPRYCCLLAELDGQSVGIALFNFTYSTWTSRARAYLEDLYVAPKFRRHGVARSLMAGTGDSCYGGRLPASPMAGTPQERSCCEILRSDRRHA